MQKFVATQNCLPTCNEAYPASNLSLKYFKWEKLQLVTRYKAENWYERVMVVSNTVGHNWHWKWFYLRGTFFSLWGRGTCRCMVLSISSNGNKSISETQECLCPTIGGIVWKFRASIFSFEEEQDSKLKIHLTKSFDVIHKFPGSISKHSFLFSSSSWISSSFKYSETSVGDHFY